MRHYESQAQTNTGKGKYMAYAEQNSVEKGLRFKTRSGLVVETTGGTTYIAGVNIYVHEVEVVEGPSTGGKFLHNLSNRAE